MKRWVVAGLLAGSAWGQTSGADANSNVYADSFAGRDIGARINAAFASQAGRSGAPRQGVVVNLNPGATYDYTTQIAIPNSTVSPFVFAPVLDCHGAVLNWTGAGMDAVTVLGENGYKTGEIRNCTFLSSVGTGPITFHSRTDFSVSHSYFGVSVRFINDRSPGSPAYTEENHWDDIQISVPTGLCGVTFSNGPDVAGGGSFFYNWFSRIHIDLAGSAGGFCLATTAGVKPVVFGSNFDLHVNAGGMNNAVFRLGAGTVLSRGVVTIAGELTSGAPPQYDVFVEPGATFYNSGYSTAGFRHGYAAGVPIASVNFMGGAQTIVNSLTGPAGAVGTKSLKDEPGGTHPGRQCETEQLGGPIGVTAFLLAGLGSEQDCVWEIAARQTSNEFPDVDVNPSDARQPQLTTRVFASSQGGVGFGPGFSTTDYPLSTAEVRGSLTVRRPGVGSLATGVTATRQIDPAGNISDLFTGGTNKNPSFHYRQLFYDTYSRLTYLPGLDCYARGEVYCSIPNLATGTPENTDFAGQLRLSGGSATYTFSGAYRYAPICTASDTSAAAPTQVVTSNATLTIRGSGADMVNYICVARQ